mmetsp:Transcript_53573/g.44981  ORF Transcript_53573/g.44981 Transcript_53573/m.44981 type:complete len:129 (+) Transcript_53573:653-1039(+)
MSSGSEHTCVLINKNIPENITSQSSPTPNSTSNSNFTTNSGSSDLGCMGKNTFGQSDIPASFSSNILSISLGAYHTCAISTRLLVCWGNNKFNQTTVPKQFFKAMQVSASLHTCAVHDNQVGCWGRND